MLTLLELKILTFLRVFKSICLGWWQGSATGGPGTDGLVKVQAVQRARSFLGFVSTQPR